MRDEIGQLNSICRVFVPPPTSTWAKTWPTAESLLTHVTDVQLFRSPASLTYPAQAASFERTEDTLSNNNTTDLDSRAFANTVDIMCGTCNGDAADAAPPAANSTTDNAAPSASTSNGVYPAQGNPASSPYQSVQDYISNVGRFKIIGTAISPPPRVHHSD